MLCVANRHMAQDCSMFKDRSRTVQFSFFLSTERPFHPKINGKPLILIHRLTLTVAPESGYPSTYLMLLN